ncbi:MAG: hypothetical protein IKV05_03495 [Bacteroidales bacterium]|nr:hypothetical protein [Bacteroidales bacterium]
MIKKQREKMALSCHSFEGRYKSPEIKTVDLLSEGVMCSSVVGIGHDDFTEGDSFDL